MTCVPFTIDTPLFLDVDVDLDNDLLLFLTDYFSYSIEYYKNNMKSGKIIQKIRKNKDEDTFITSIKKYGEPILSLLTFFHS